MHVPPIRTLAVAAALALGATGVAACGDDDETTASGGSATSAASTAAFPVTIEHKFGSTEIPAAPKRVVTVGYTELDTVLALGVTPVGTRDFLGGYDYKKRPWAPAGKAIPSVGGEQIDFESVAAKRPDLIVALNTGMPKAEYEKLSRIAPTLAQDGRYVDFGMPWSAQTLMIGKALGLEDKAKEVVAGVEAKFAKAKEDHPDLVGKTAVLAYGSPDGFGAYSSQDTRSRFFTDLGMKLPARVDEIAGKAFYTELSSEQFRLLDQDVVVYFGTQADLRKDPVLKRLDADAEDRIVYLDLGDQAAGALGFSSALSLPYLLDDLLPKLDAAVDGDPGTKVEQPT